MITKDNLPEVLRCFGFTESQNVWTKKYSTGASITVDFNSKKIGYAPLDKNFASGEFPTKEKPAKGFVIHRDTTLDFSHNENYVCLVCVHLLLKKGYEPKHIVFEPAFKVGHVNKPSYGDILVFDKEYNPLVLIENKTYGTEFSKEWNLMQKDGGQLFSYLGPLVNEMGLCQNLVLLAADYEEKEIILKNHIITLKDNEKRLNELENAKSFADAQGKYFEVWDQTYGKSFETKGLFEDDIAAYSVGKLKYTINDLNGLSHAEIRPIYHEFATILRNHAITDFEHSFYMLIDLFLCKITDELNNPDDLQFYYKGIARDTPKEYCKRLLKLYQLGKQQLFNVEVVNKDEEDIQQIFEDTNRSLTNGLYDGIKKLFEEIKFYNIKKFNFIDVENREEFEMNFQILIKIAALIQDINLSSSETNHFFGDLFEGLLSKNVHQTEGQFFTPLPIVNFIIKSLPQFPNTNKVKVLDYACGAGHFLTEFVKHYPKAKIYGIEKSQTLSQVAKIATIINGNKDSRIIFKDSLSLLNTMDVRYQGFDKESFDCIIANPPYSVKGFLNTMEQKDRDQFELAKTVDEKSYSTNRSIECFFVERAQHLLKKDGLLGIILPVSLFSNINEKVYIKTREIIFANFNILAMAAMNSRTFGSTGTSTVILFAQKVKKNSEGLLHTFIEKKDYTQYTTCGAIDSYIQKQGYPKAEYFAFMQDNILGENLKNTEVFKDYKSNFKTTRISKSIQKEWFTLSDYYKEGLKEKTKEYKERLTNFILSDNYKELEECEYQRQFVAFAKHIECKKLNVYIQIESNIIAILQSPPEKIDNKSNKAEVVKFLGYDWSNRKGDEGIKYLTSNVQETEYSEEDDDKDAEIVQAINSIKYIETPLYNPNDFSDETKFSYALRKHIIDSCMKFSFGSKTNCEVPFSGQEKELLNYVRLSDMIKFDRTTFNLAVDTNFTKRSKEVRYRFLTKRLEQLFLSVNGSKTKIGKERINPQGTIPVITQESGNFIAGYTDDKKPITDLPLIVFGDHSCTFKYVDFEFVRGADGTQLLKVNEDEILTEFLYNFLLTIQIENSERYERHFKYLKNVQVPLPPKAVQQMIVAQCQDIDAEAGKAKEKIVELQEEIRGIVASTRGEKKRLGAIAHFKNGLNYKESHDGDTVNIVGVADFKNNKSPEWDKVKTITISENVDDSYLLHKNDLVTVRSNGSRELVGRFMLIDKEPEERTTFSGFSIRVRIVSDEVNSEFLYYLLSSANVRQRLTTGSNGANIKSLNQDLLSNLEIPLPSLSEQMIIVGKIREIEDEITSLKEICDGVTVRKEAILRRELIDDDKQRVDITENKTIDLHSSTEGYQNIESDTLMAAEPFECYTWNRFDQAIIDFFGGDKTILVGCYKDKNYQKWIISNGLYTVRLGNTTGSMEEKRPLFKNTTILILYDLDNIDKLAAFSVTNNKEMNKNELLAMNYPNKHPRKSYMTFNITPLEMDLSLLVKQHLIEQLIEIDPGKEKGTPVFIEP